MKPIGTLIGLLALFTASMPASPAPEAVAATVFSGPNPLLVAGAEAMRSRQYREGVRLTLEGLKQVNEPRDVAAALSNLCAGHVALKEYELAVRYCNEALALDSRNWRTWNNRAAAHLGQGQHDAALADVQAGLALAPNSVTLRRTMSMVEADRRAREEQATRAIKA
jgi:tetratricopeptide (TPR) repeat protein